MAPRRWRELPSMTSSDPTSSDEQAGPPLEELLERHLADLNRYVQRNMGRALAQRESCADLVQSICREVLQSRRSFHYAGDAAFRRWLLQVALHKLIDRRGFYSALRRENGKRMADLSSVWQVEELAKLARTLGSPSGEAMMREELHRLASALEQLGEADRTIIRLIHIDGLTHLDVSQRLDCTLQQSRSRLFRALIRLSSLVRDAKR
jgi:RNA polymerase sigma factor (sigma-70 family)